jgi:hypothetical protein
VAEFHPPNDKRSHVLHEVGARDVLTVRVEVAHGHDRKARGVDPVTRGATEDGRASAVGISVVGVRCSTVIGEV